MGAASEPKASIMRVLAHAALLSASASAERAHASQTTGISSAPRQAVRLNFLSATLGSHMVLQRAPKVAVVWGHTASGAVVTTTMTAADPSICMLSHGQAAHCGTQTWNSTAGADGTWRQQLPPIPGTRAAYNFTFSSSNSSEESAAMHDVLFGDVFLCGGQSNMEYSLAADYNKTSERQRANDFSNIRIFSVGHATQSQTPLQDLQTVWEPWQVASNTTVEKDFSPGHTLFSTFSAVCWYFGRSISLALSPTGEVPIGLISNNWGGTKLQVWVPAPTFAKCGLPAPFPDGGPMWNAMILPYATGPMALSGFAWYQGEGRRRHRTRGTICPHGMMSCSQARPTRALPC
jgi:sialate O-acetylesterase